jgi:capsular polysaccharide biosynthesis protein
MPAGMSSSSSQASLERVPQVSIGISELIEILLAAAWRRRWLLLIPLLAFLGISAVAAALWPRMYSSQILIMLQEREVTNPLSSTTEITREGRLKADEIEALLKSERVLSSAILDMTAGKKALTPKDLEGELRDLKKAITVRVVGSEFIQIELKDTNPHGLGERLATVMTRFLERLLSREDSMKTARKFAMEQRQRDVERAKSALGEWTARTAAPDGANVIAALSEAISNVAGLQSKLDLSRNRLIDLASTVLGDRLDPAQIAQAVATGQSTALARAQAGTGGGNSNPQRAAVFNDLEIQLAAFQATTGELSQAQEIAQKLREKNASAYEHYLEKQRLDGRLSQAMSQLEVHERHTGKSAGPGSIPFGLVAPENIRIIDEPRDPVSPATSILKIVVACIGAGIGLGVGLAALAEQLDDRIYSSEGLERLAGVPVIVRLPKLDAEARRIASGVSRFIEPDTPPPAGRAQAGAAVRNPSVSPSRPGSGGSEPGTQV